MNSVVWKCGGREIAISDVPAVMGILNVTPDSFSDGGRYIDHKKAVAHAIQMVKDGARIIDVGGESTRPGAQEVPAEEEKKRIIPVIKSIRAETDVVISVDTKKASVAEEAVKAGAEIINDVSACTADPEMIKTAVDTGAGVVLMHMKGSPDTMQKDPSYKDVVKEVRDYLAARMDELVRNGITRPCLAVDPGIGFGKTVEHNIDLISNLDVLTGFGVPVVVGLSRKSFLGKITGRDADERLASSIAGAVFSAIKGAHVLRVHDVRETVDALKVNAVLSGRLKPC